jgi:hypothetical protein
MLEGAHEQVWASRAVNGDEPRAYESHLAIAVERSAAEVVELARAAGFSATCLDQGLLDLNGSGLQPAPRQPSTSTARSWRSSFAQQASAVESFV